MAKAVTKMTVEEIDVEIERLGAEVQKDMAAKDALREKMRARQATLDDLNGAREAQLLLAGLSDEGRAALAQQVKANGVEPSSTLGTPGGKG